jgi:hypothetical protein
MQPLMVKCVETELFSRHSDWAFYVSIWLGILPILRFGYDADAVYEPY